MPKTVLHTEVDFDDPTMTPTFLVFMEDKAGDESVPDRTHIRITFFDEWNDSNSLVEWLTHLDDSISTFAPGNSATLRGLLLKLLNAALIAKGYKSA